jgi:Fe-S-cluster containining protein
MNDSRIVINGIEVDRLIFTQRFVDGCDMARCGGECCTSGVWADVTERDVILANQGMFVRYMDDSQTTDPEKWFEKEIVDDLDFDSGKAVGTETHNDKCVFQMRNGYCVLQYASTLEGKHPWAIKPKYCVMFPVVIADNVLSYDDDHSSDMHYCGLHCTVNHTKTVFEACGPEIEYAMGEDAYKQLVEIYNAEYART